MTQVSTKLKEVSALLFFPGATAAASSSRPHFEAAPLVSSGKGKISKSSHSSLGESIFWKSSCVDVMCVSRLYSFSVHLGVASIASQRA